MKFSQLLVSIAFTWIGFVSAISFMESWLKFQAPGLTLPVGLGIGRLVFGTLNKVEWVFALSSLLLIFIGGEFKLKINLFLLIPVVILLLQTFWLLPVMDHRAALHISGAEVPPSHLHFYYVGMEIIKIICLFVYGIKLHGNLVEGNLY